MSAKNVDQYNRLRSVTVGFRVSPEESDLLNRVVALSGLTKQDYIIKKLLNRDVVVQGNPRVYKALRNQLADVLYELKRIGSSNKLSDELLAVIEMITAILGDMKEVSE
ncbi:MAG: hypothetical protein NC122_09635 [Faecalibacterium sp.]|nr:hypothetical protein [Ruminococcus sp.]MCM1486452.1 hypothetical protein [Faecalibacterium sp.]